MGIEDLGTHKADRWSNGAFTVRNGEYIGGLVQQEPNSPPIAD